MEKRKGDDTVNISEIVGMGEEWLDSIDTGIYIVDPSGQYVYGNGAFLKMAGGTKEDIPKLNAFRLVEEGYVKESVVVRAFEEKRQTVMVNRVDNRRGMIYDQLITATPIFNGDGEIEYVIAEMMNLQTLQQKLEKGTLATVDYGDLEKYLQVEKVSATESVVAVSESMRSLLALSREVAVVDSTVLITGETGTGKEVIAHYIHECSNRKEAKLLEINCAALPENLLESELFGYEKGAYTGALNTGKQGLLQNADGGTLFLDEINSMPLSIQGKLLRVLETKKVKRLGALNEETVNFRLIAATNQDLEKCVEEGTFRADLYYRLSVITLEIPPLRERREDIPVLAIRFLKEFCDKYSRTKALSQGVAEKLLGYDWPGNVRELKNVMERVVVSSSALAVEINQLPGKMLREDEKTAARPDPIVAFDGWVNWDADNFSLEEYMEYCEKYAVEKAIKICGSTRKAAKLLKVNQSTVVRKRQKYREKDHT